MAIKEKTVIDISYYNTITDWSLVKKNVDAVIIRMGYRGYGKTGKMVLDSKFKEFTAACQKYKIPFGYYFFPTSITNAEAANEAKFVLRNLPEGYKEVLPIFADSEPATANRIGRSDNLSKSARTKFLLTFCTTIEKAGYKAGVYSSTSWFKNNLNMAQLNKFAVWCAQYNTRCTYTGEKLLWQYTSKGVIPGVKGTCDVSKWYVEESTAKKKKKTKKVKVEIPNLRIRKGAGVTTEWTGEYTGVGVFEVTQIKKTGWAKLADGRGWISMDYAEEI